MKLQNTISIKFVCYLRYSYRIIQHNNMPHTFVFGFTEKQIQIVVRAFYCTRTLENNRAVRFFFQIIQSIIVSNIWKSDLYRLYLHNYLHHSRKLFSYCLKIAQICFLIIIEEILSFQFCIRQYLLFKALLCYVKVDAKQI